MEEKCKHNWYIVTEIEAQPWHEFMSFRGAEEDRLVSSFVPTHTIICNQCFEIKKVS